MQDDLEDDDVIMDLGDSGLEAMPAEASTASGSASAKQSLEAEKVTFSQSFFNVLFLYKG